MWFGWGAMEGQYADTAAGMLEILEREKGISFEIQHAEYQDRCMPTTNAPPCLGSCGCTRQRIRDWCWRFRQRITFQYLRTAGRAKGRAHPCFERLAGKRGDRRTAPFRAGKETYRYVQEILRRSQTTPRKLILQDVRPRPYPGGKRVVFAEAQRTHSVVYSVNGPIEMCEKLGRLAGRLPGCCGAPQLPGEPGLRGGGEPVYAAFVRQLHHATGARTAVYKDQGRNQKRHDWLRKTRLVRKLLMKHEFWHKVRKGAGLTECLRGTGLFGQKWTRCFVDILFTNQKGAAKWKKRF